MVLSFIKIIYYFQRPAGLQLSGLFTYSVSFFRDHCLMLTLNPLTGALREVNGGINRILIVIGDIF